MTNSVHLTLGLYFGNTLSCSGTRTQHDLLAQLNKVILASKKLNKPTQGYKLQVSKTVSLFKWIGSSLLYVIIFSNQKLNNESTFSTLWLLQLHGKFNLFVETNSD